MMVNTWTCHQFLYLRMDICEKRKEKRKKERRVRFDEKKKKKILRPPQVCALTKTKWPKFFGVKHTLLPYVWEGKKKVKVVLRNGLPTIAHNQLYWFPAVFCKERVRNEVERALPQYFPTGFWGLTWTLFKWQLV